MIVRSRKLRTALAVVVAAGGILFAVASPAQATRYCGTGGPPPPETSLVFTGSSIEATYITFPCNTVPPVQQPLITIIRDGKVVTSGNGYVDYNCAGTAEGSFEITYFGTYNYACG